MINTYTFYVYVSFSRDFSVIIILYKGRKIRREASVEVISKPTTNFYGNSTINSKSISALLIKIVELFSIVKLILGIML